jgi:3-deoxy-D-manno-octulosonic-acid transferase
VYLLVYKIALWFYHSAIRMMAPFKPKASDWVEGRKGLIGRIQSELSHLEKRPVWVHASSVGEFEQGRPVIESIKRQYPDIPLVLTFYSPSGFNLHHDYELADHIYYLPEDGKKSRQFVDAVNPRVALFIKYEFWYYYFKALHDLGIPNYLISAKLSPGHLFFKWYGIPHRKILNFLTMIFAQDDETLKLLKNIDVKNVVLTGDTRIDRVASVLREKKSFPIVERLTKGKKAIVGGSTWSAEDSMLTDLYKSIPDDYVLIIAPHEILESKILKLKTAIGERDVIRYSEVESSDRIPPEKRVLILDVIGVLKHIYHLAEWTLIGGGFGDGIHNILEPAAFGVPMIFGPKYTKFAEAHALLVQGGAVCVSNKVDFINAANHWIDDRAALQKSSEVCKAFIDSNTGATEKVMNVITREFND